MAVNIEASLRLEIAHLQQAAAKARGEITKLKEHAKKEGAGLGQNLFKGLAPLAAGGALSAGMISLIKRGVEFNKNIGDSEKAIAQVLGQFKNLSAEAGKNEAAQAMKAMVDLEPQTAATLTGLVDGFMATLGASQSVGIDVQQNIDLVGKFSNALANSNIHASQLGQEMRSIMTGTIGADSSLAKVLNISNADIEKAKSAGKLYEFLVGKIGKLGEAGDTAGVAFSSLNSAIDKVAGLMTEGLFSQGVQGAKEMASFLEQNADLFRDLGSGIAFATEHSVKLLAKLNEMRKEQVEISGKRWGGLLGFNDVYNTDEDLASRKQRDEQGAKDAFAKHGPAKNWGDSWAGPPSHLKGAAEKGGAASGLGGSAPDEKEILKVRQEILRIQEAEDSLAQKRLDDYLSILPPNLKLIELKREMLRLEQERDQLTGPGFDERRLQIETELLDLRKQSRDAEKDLADEKIRAAEKQAEDDAKSGDQASKLALFEQEMALIDAKLAKDKELTAELERQAEIQQLKNQLMDDAGLSEAEALRRATERVDKEADLKKQIDAAKDSRYDADGRRADGRRQIKGYSRDGQGDATDARARAQARVDAAREGYNSSVKSAFGSLDDQTRKNAAAGGGLTNEAQKNAARENATNGAGGGMAEQAAQIVLTALPQILSTLQGGAS